MFDLSQVCTKKELVADGAWVTDVLPDIDVLMRSTSCHLFKEFGQQLMKPYEQVGKQPNADEQEKLAARSFSETIVLGWRQKTIVDGKVSYLDGVMFNKELIKWSKESALKLFLELGPFMDAVAKEATKISNFKERVDAELSGN